MTGRLVSLATGNEADALRRAPEVFLDLAPSICAFANEVESVSKSQTLGFTGCGSSLDVADALSAVGDHAAFAVTASEARPEATEVTWIGVTRSGMTAELLEVMAGGAVEHVITCEPLSPAAASARTVLDLSAARDSGHVAALSTLITAAAIALLVTRPENREQAISGLAESLRSRANLRAIKQAPVAWLSPWRGHPLGRELVRKSIETGRRSSYSHTFEFLHGDDLAYAGYATWAVIDTEERLSRFEKFARSRNLEGVSLELIPFDWATTTPGGTISLLTDAFQILFEEAASIAQN